MTHQPTADQCTSNDRVQLDDGRTAVAAWYPSMGGYVGKCLIIGEQGSDGCVEVLVWHDGDFPFGDGRSPAELHHCDPADFIRFGEIAQALTT